MMLAMGIMGYAIWQIFQGANPYAWGGVLLTTAPIIVLISWLMMFQNVARTSARFPVLGILGAAGVALASWAWFAQGANIIAPVLAVGGWIGFLVYAFWYSSFGRSASDVLKVGAQLPAFSVKGVNGATVSSAELTKRPAILMFYRGNWCPLCVAQIKELVQHYQDIQSLGVRVALVSPQPHKNTMSLAKKFDVAFDFLTDEGNNAARALGIDNPHGLPMGMQMMGYDSETVLPTVIVTGQNGRIIWANETDNYRVRPEPDVYLDILRQHGVIATT